MQLEEKEEQKQVKFQRDKKYKFLIRCLIDMTLQCLNLRDSEEEKEGHTHSDKEKKYHKRHHSKKDKEKKTTNW